MAYRRFDASHALRYSLLAALGLLGAACGGVSTSDGEPKPVDKTGQCSSPKIDPKTQLPVCSEGFSHRPTAVSCQALLNGADAPADPGIGAPEPSLCGTEDCTQIRFGYCDYGPEGPHCASGCIEDGDCAWNQICSCTNSNSPTGGECVASDCATDADCEDGLCASTREICGELRFACQSDADECVSDGDCANGICSITGEGHRACFGGACGRPFLVLSEPRLPPVTARGDWLESSVPRVDHLTLAERGELARHWTKLGQMEHASIAAFARFSLQLLALGAPPELVEQCTQALADETAHTKLCFGIASAYAGHAIGPGPLDVAHSLEVTTLSDIVELVIAEGCFGETSAALEALDAAQTASDPVIQAAYTRIAQDEQRHAELAFRFVRWALQCGGDEVAERIREALASDFAEQHPARAVAEPCLAALVAQIAAA